MNNVSYKIINQTFFELTVHDFTTNASRYALKRVFLVGSVQYFELCLYVRKLTTLEIFSLHIFGWIHDNFYKNQIFFAKKYFLQLGKKFLIQPHRCFAMQQSWMLNLISITQSILTVLLQHFIPIFYLCGVYYFSLVLFAVFVRVFVVYRLPVN